mgnify:CR=1 FL=1
MDPHRTALESRLRAIKEPIAQPVVATMDMGLQHFVFSSEGAANALGMFGAWPAYGPFALSSADMNALRKASATQDLDLMVAALNRTPLAFIHAKMLDMFEFLGDDDEYDAAWLAELQKDFVEAVLATSPPPDQRLYIFFHEFEAELPLVFNTRRGLMDYFVSVHQLTPWEEMSTAELDLWCEVLNGDDPRFTIIPPS